MRYKARLFLALGLSAFLLACDDDDPVPATPIAGTVIEVTATDNVFSPTQIVASAGEIVTVVLRNQGNSDHAITFELPDGEVGSDTVRPGESTIFDVEMPAEGSYTFYCPIDNHRELGMVGTLTVLPAGTSTEGTGNDGTGTDPDATGTEATGPGGTGGEVPGGGGPAN